MKKEDRRSFIKDVKKKKKREERKTARQGAVFVFVGPCPRPVRKIVLSSQKTKRNKEKSEEKRGREEAICLVGCFFYDGEVYVHLNRCIQQISFLYKREVCQLGQ